MILLTVEKRIKWKRSIRFDEERRKWKAKYNWNENSSNSFSLGFLDTIRIRDELVTNNQIYNQPEPITMWYFLPSNTAKAGKYSHATAKEIKPRGEHTSFTIMKGANLFWSAELNQYF